MELLPIEIIQIKQHKIAANQRTARYTGFAQAQCPTPASCPHKSNIFSTRMLDVFYVGMIASATKSRH